MGNTISYTVILQHNSSTICKVLHNEFNTYNEFFGCFFREFFPKRTMPQIVSIYVLPSFHYIFGSSKWTQEKNIKLEVTVIWDDICMEIENTYNITVERN